MHRCLVSIVVLFALACCPAVAAQPSPSERVARTFVDEGRRHLRIQDLRRAKRCAFEALDLSPRLADAHAMLGAIALEAGDVERALAPLTRAIERAPDVAQFHFLLGAARLRLGRFDDAIAALTESWHLGISRPRAYVLLARALGATGSFYEAARTLMIPALLDPGDGSVHLEAGRMLYASEPMASSIKSLERAAQLRPADPVIQRGLALSRYQAGDVTGAVEALASSVRLQLLTGHERVRFGDQDESRLRDLLRHLQERLEGGASAIAADYDRVGTVMTALGDARGALKYHLEAERLQPDQPSFLCRLGIASHRAGKLEAFRYFWDASRMSGAHPDVALCWMKLALDAGNVNGVVYHLRHDVPSDDESVERLALWASALARAGRLAEAVEVCERGLRRYPRSAWLWNIRSRIALDANDEELAAWAARRAVAANPDDWRNHQRSAMALERQHRNLAVVGAYRRAIEENPSAAHLHVRLSHALAGVGDWAGAHEASRRAAELEPDDALAHYLRGTASMSMGQWWDAADALQDALRLDPEDAFARKWYCVCGEAIEVLPRLEALRRGGTPPADPIEALWLAWTATRAGQARLATDLWTIALADPAMVRSPFGNTANLFGDAARAAVGALAAAEAGANASRRRLRRRALTWLRASLRLRVAGLADADARVASRSYMRRALSQWLYDPAYDSIREPCHLRRLGASERQEWTAFWERVETLVARRIE